MNNLYLLLLTTSLFFINYSDSTGQLASYDCIEKSYLQTDKPIYLPGDDVWIKGWIVNGANMPTILSQKANLIITKPDGSTLFDKTIKLENGSLSESITLQKNLKGGIYKIRLKTSWMSEMSTPNEYTKEFIIQKYDPPRILMYMELDKESYGPGDQVIVDFNAKSLKDNPIAEVNVRYDVFVEGKVVQKVYDSTNSKGWSKAKFKVPNDINSSNLSVNAKINYRNQIESVSKRVPIIIENIDLQFFPEGGDLINNFNNTIAFKALAENGEPADVSGEIIDANGNKITSFESAHDGMGILEFIPKNTAFYLAKICSPYESTQPIPIHFSRSNRCKLSIPNITHESIDVHILGNLEENLQLQLSNSYKELWKQTLNSRASKSEFQIPISKYPRGIHKLTLLQEGETLSERLIFLHPEKELDISVQLDREKYGLRDKVTATIVTNDPDGSPISADLSIAVVEDKMLSFADDKQSHLVSELLLSSELKGAVHEPNYYFDSITIEKKKHLDLVMLTHGWRTILSQDNIEEAQKYLTAQQSYFGQVCSLNEKKGIQTQVLIVDQLTDKIFVVETDKDGYFMLPFYYDKTFKMIANRERGRAKIKTWKFEDIEKKNKAKAKELKHKILQQPKYIDISHSNKDLPPEVVDFEEGLIMSLEEGVLMDAVEIMEYKVPLIEVDNTTVGLTITGEAIRSLPLKSVNAIAAKTAGISIADNGPISIRGSRSDATIYYIDGVRVSNILVDEVNRELEMNIDHRQYKKTIYLEEGSELVNRTVKTYHSYYPKKRFYVPMYTKKKVTERTDFRKTIYWNPSIQTNEDGKATFSFYTSDEITSFSLIAEGITANGKVGRNTTKVITSKPLSVDCKLPNYFVLGDTAEVSLIVNNESDTDQYINVNATCESIEITPQHQENILIKKGKNVSILLQMIPKSEASKTPLHVSVTSTDDYDFLSKNVTVISPYFPMHFSYSGYETDSFEIELHDPITSSIKSQIKTYNPVSTAMEGIESLLRRPSGCFEQVSSSTYPNVMVYQYLKENTQVQSNKLTEAMQFIKEGYKKLEAYETEEDGFEWYGNTPANVALTAYGLLEFTDMAKIYSGVDEKMIQRTIQFLLDKKDGKGGFQNGNGMDRFGTVLYEVQTAYVLYALSRQNVQQSTIEKEYNSSKNHAWKTKDLYLNALTALTASNFGKEKDYHRSKKIIMDQLNFQSLKEVTCNNTITRSGQNDKNTETLALIALSLMVDKTSIHPRTSEIIDHLISNRKYGRFGSTQATCLAIQAILTYSKSKKAQQSDINSEIFASLDNTQIGKIVDSLDMTQNITTERHNAIVEYSPPSEKSFEFNVQYLSTLPPSNMDPELDLSTSLIHNNCLVADQVSMQIELSNLKNKIAANPTVMIGIPSGMSVQIKQLKELQKAKQFEYFEIFDNKLVLYFNELYHLESRQILLDLKANIAGSYTAPPSCAYPYYDEDNCTWIKGERIRIDRTAPSKVN